VIIILAFLLLAGCKHDESPVKMIAEKPSKDAVEFSFPDQGWSGIVDAALDQYGQGLLFQKTVKDAADFCPKYNTLTIDEKKSFYISLFAAMAKYESDFNPKSQYRESFKSSDGDYVVSRGLLQISKGSSQYYNCGVTNAEQLHDPKINLECGVKILNKWVVKDECLACNYGQWMGGARYWAVLRNTKSPYEKIKKITNNIPICKGLQNGNDKGNGT
jgi:hypothetical protein